MLPSYIEYWKHHSPTPVGISRIGSRWARWHVVYNNGESKPVSIVWNIMPKRFRSWYLHHRHERIITFEELVAETNTHNIPK